MAKAKYKIGSMLEGEGDTFGKVVEIRQTEAGNSYGLEGGAVLAEDAVLAVYRKQTPRVPKERKTSAPRSKKSKAEANSRAVQ